MASRGDRLGVGAELSAGQARRIALAASGFTGRRPATPTRARLAGVVGQLGAVQLDSVNVLTRAHYLPAFSRLGGYDRALLDAASGSAPRSLFEYWGHEACLLPVALQPLLRWRMDRVHDDAWGGMVRVQREHPGLVAEVGQAVRELGPVTITELEAALAHDHPRPKGGWGWNWSVVKRAVEYLFWAGEITSAGRDATFRRRYAAPEVVLPAAIMAAPTPQVGDAQRQLVAIGARAMGVSTAADLADYFRLPAATTRTAIGDLVTEGLLERVRVAGWADTAYLWAGAAMPSRVSRVALLVPFDPLIWFRPRVQRLFSMVYRIEIYTPAAQRRYGYYVLPLLFGDRLVARVDLKADRPGARLLVQGAHPEPGMPGAAVPALAGALVELGTWLGVPEVVVEPGTPLSEPLQRELVGA